MTTLHIDLLIALRLAGHFGLTPDALLTHMRRGSHRNLDEPRLRKALSELSDKFFFATPFTSSTGSKRWCITGRGEAALKEDGI